MSSSRAASAWGRLALSPVNHGFRVSNSRIAPLCSPSRFMTSKARSRILRAHSRSNTVSSEGVEVSGIAKPGEVSGSTATFLARLVDAAIGEEMFQRTQQIGTKPPALRGRAIQRLAFQHAREELVRQLARGVLVPYLTSKKCHDRPIA